MEVAVPGEGLVGVLGGVAAGGVGEGELGQGGFVGLGEEFGDGGVVEGGHWTLGRRPPGYQVWGSSFFRITPKRFSIAMPVGCGA